MLWVQSANSDVSQGQTQNGELYEQNNGWLHGDETHTLYKRGTRT